MIEFGSVVWVWCGPGDYDDMPLAPHGHHPAPLPPRHDAIIQSHCRIREESKIEDINPSPCQSPHKTTEDSSRITEFQLFYPFNPSLERNTFTDQ
jgi:hypothetical protein